MIPPLCPKHGTKMSWIGGRWICIEPENPLEGKTQGGMIPKSIRIGGIELVRFTIEGVPVSLHEEVKVYDSKRIEINVHGLWGSTLIVELQ